MEQAAFGRLASLAIRDGNSEGTMTWAFSDADGRQAEFQVDGTGVGTVFQTLVGLLEKLVAAPKAGDPPTALGALPAQNIAISAGRHPKEVALHIHVGPVDIAYLVPLDAVVINMGELISKLYTDPPVVPTH